MESFLSAGGWDRQNFCPGLLGKVVEGDERVRGQEKIRYRKQDMVQCWEEFGIDAGFKPEQTLYNSC